MKKQIKNKSASVRAKLASIARAENTDFDALLLRYLQERFLYRLGISKFSSRFVLKGGLFLVCLQMPKSRPTKDIDFLAEEIKNDPAELERIFAAIAGMAYDDGVQFLPSSISSETIKEDADYEGIRLKIDATLGQARQRLQMDIGFGDIIIPQAIQMEFPTILPEESPKVKAYSIESVISEKFEAMIKLAMANSRMKDFYDVYFLSANQDFKGERLKKAVESTFRRRRTPMPDSPLVFRPEFREDKGRQRQWVAFLSKLRLKDINQEFSEIMNRITEFLSPIVLSIEKGTGMRKTWISKSGIWQ